MQVAGSFRYDAPPAVMYSLFTDPEALLQATPGLESLTETAPDCYTATLKVGIGGFALHYSGTLVVTDRVPDQGYWLKIDARTHNGYGRGEARFRFLPAGGGTEVSYTADVELGGAQRLLPSLARGLVDFFLRGMAEVVTERMHGTSR